MSETRGSPGGPPLRLDVPWPAILATATAGAAIVTFFIVPAGSILALVVGLLATVALALAAVVVSRRRRRRLGGVTAPQPALITLETTSPAAEEIGLALAKEAAQRLDAPAAAVLVPRRKRLVAAGSIGDWGMVRRWLARWEAERSAAPGAAPSSAAGAAANGADDDAPPELPLDDVLPRLLGMYPRAVPFERWRDLSDAPVALLPLVALADRGAAVAVSLRHRGRFAGLCILGRRPNGKPYTDDELRLLEQIANQAGASLDAALRRQ